VAHHDLKIENLFVDKYLRMKIADFDLAFRKGDLYSNSLGTKGYDAPELKIMCRSGIFGYDPMKADIYSAGMIFMILITQKMPFYVENDVEIWRVNN
jgi:serine/threonine protein kinase